MKSRALPRPVRTTDPGRARRPSAVLLLVAIAQLGCAGLLGVKKPLTGEQINTAIERCFRSYADGPQPPNPRATPAIRAWYASLTPAIVATFDDDGAFNDGAMAHAIAAGVPEADFLSGQNPDPSPDCGLGWSHDDVGDHRFSNAGQAARSVVWRSAFAQCATQFDALWPALRAANDDAAEALAALPPSAEPDAVWGLYHRAGGDRSGHRGAAGALGHRGGRGAPRGLP